MTKFIELITGAMVRKSSIIGFTHGFYPMTGRPTLCVHCCGNDSGEPFYCEFQTMDELLKYRDDLINRLSEEV